MSSPSFTVSWKVSVSGPVSSSGESNVGLTVLAPLSETDIETIVEYYASSAARSVLYMQLPCEEESD